ncbi:MAG TPA: HAD family hydrolase [Flavitalea sp.]|nr:HAD family hydrolase [Flavitalea sp.]
MPIKLVVFDMAGTTVYDNNDVAAAFVHAFNFYELDTAGVNINHLMGYKKTVAIETVLKQIGSAYDADLVEDIHLEFMHEMLGHYRSSEDIKPLPFAEEVFDELRSQNIKIALNTGFSQNIADVIIERLGWAKYIDSYISSSEVALGRPSPDMIYELMRRTGVTYSNEVAKIGDTSVDINEGRNAGCGLVVAITTGAYSKDELLQCDPDFIISNLSELPPLILDFA